MKKPNQYLFILILFCTTLSLISSKKNTNQNIDIGKFTKIVTNNSFNYYGEYKTQSIKYVDTENEAYNKDLSDKNYTAHIIFYAQNDSSYLQIKIDNYPNLLSYACSGEPVEYEKDLYIVGNCIVEHLDDEGDLDIIFQKSSDSLRLLTLFDKRDYWLYDNLELIQKLSTK